MEMGVEGYLGPDEAQCLPERTWEEIPVKTEGAVLNGVVSAMGKRYEKSEKASGPGRGQGGWLPGGLRRKGESGFYAEVGDYDAVLGSHCGLR
jgi:hypothetical protein